VDDSISETQVNELLLRFDGALVNYFNLSDKLADDVTDLLDSRKDSQSWRRNFIRTSVALAEGYCHCFRDMANSAMPAMSQRASTLTKGELKVLDNERNCDAIPRIQDSITAFHKMFGLLPIPVFNVEPWISGRAVIGKRHTFMHPKIGQDLDLTEDEWLKLDAGIQWLFAVLFGAVRQMADRHNEKE
jgi:hypothetical protein